MSFILGDKKIERMSYWWSHFPAALGPGAYEISSVNMRIYNISTDGISPIRFGRFALMGVIFREYCEDSTSHNMIAYTALRSTPSVNGDQSLLQRTAGSDRYNTDVFAYHHYQALDTAVFNTWNRDFEYRGFGDGSQPIKIFNADEPLYLCSMVYNSGAVALTSPEHSMNLLIDYVTLD